MKSPNSEDFNKQTHLSAFYLLKLISYALYTFQRSFARQKLKSLQENLNTVTANLRENCKIHSSVCTKIT